MDEKENFKYTTKTMAFFCPVGMSPPRATPSTRPPRIKIELDNDG